MKIKDKRLSELARAAESQGWTLEPTKSGHIRWRPPEGGPFVISPSTPSDHRSTLNTRSQLRRYGLNV